jgi:hypothetical protein
MPSQADDAHREVFLVRRGTDPAPSSRHHRSTSSLRFFRDLGGAPTGTSQQATVANGHIGSDKAVEGLGFDTRKYIESLLSLNR